MRKGVKAASGPECMPQIKKNKCMQFVQGVERARTQDLSRTIR